MLDIKIKYFVSGLELIKKVDNGDWIDLRAAEDIEMKSGDFKIIPLGVGMELPQGYEAHIAPRSSTFKKWGIIQANSVGVVDESYCGNNDQWGFPVIALRDTKITKNDRICQFRLIKKQEEVSFTVVDFLNNEDRGGFGSSGTSDYCSVVFEDKNIRCYKGIFMNNVNDIVRIPESFRVISYDRESCSLFIRYKYDSKMIELHAKNKNIFDEWYNLISSGITSNKYNSYSPWLSSDYLPKEAHREYSVVDIKTVDSKDVEDCLVGMGIRGCSNSGCNDSCISCRDTNNVIVKFTTDEYKGKNITIVTYSLQEV